VKRARWDELALPLWLKNILSLAANRRSSNQKSREMGQDFARTRLFLHK
jgi:hypothetical protein